MKEKILVVDDDITIKNLIGVYLKSEGYDVDNASNGEEALNLIGDYNYDLVILDIMMPKLDGILTCIKIREKFTMPIIFLSAKGEELDKIQGLTVGADDYISKPFGSMELLARVKAQLRRYKKFNSITISKNIIEIEDLVINVDTHEVNVRGENIKLTSKEFNILECLARNKGIVFSVEKLYETVWKEKFVVSDTSVVVHITNIRQKIEIDPKAPQYIKTVWGVGYKI
ncbi:response regulator transcription factor [Clostridium sporogenes]|uniref:response regulator transcription factor n=1 Tax=Clostridium sporogenes TaxID=1509 RepID=UPI0009BBB525|nr:response regulator transcription factor [Clostridium sporogenes]NFG96241.1 response regulator transcription factor [Clostridium sporogenes]NFH33725.1 response regulator transcription factor [Clostridium sporogenes]NFL19900.1 response regulator transcription factor [Clostridium sporogenes]NFN71641.1 response regulator transcription factor [Clostridium sporogenes]NFV20711.1 response regulator transcription factor [Clostridium sporogenes]